MTAPIKPFCLFIIFRAAPRAAAWSTRYSTAIDISANRLAESPLSLWAI